MINETLKSDIKEFLQQGVDTGSNEFEAQADPFWKAVSDTGTELWLDTGDMDAAAQNWTAEMKALTTNNTLLNKEIQKGIYDVFMSEADRIVSDLTVEQRVLEIAFILNARHGLRLVQKFGGMVSVELHTHLAHDYEGIIEYGMRFHEICPSHFIVKVPLTPTGMLGARTLKEKGVKINFTLNFSARQNVLISRITKPDYVNVFLGRNNAYISDNGLGDGVNVGEKATIASQRAVMQAREQAGVVTRQIAASMRSPEQVGSLAGVDVFTIPVKVAAGAKETLEPEFASKVNEEYPVSFGEGIDPEKEGLTKLWDTPATLIMFAEQIDSSPPVSGDELAQAGRDAGFEDMFPRMSGDDLAKVASDGKIPVHESWAERIHKGELAPDTLLNLAGLASFTADQKAMDERVKKVINI